MLGGPVGELEGHALGGGVAGQSVVQVAVVELLVDVVLERGELPVVDDEADLVEGSGEGQLHDVVVAVEAGARMLVGESLEAVRCGERELLADGVHGGPQ